ncbi:hypothetical protein BU15DRAFT_79711 [Melanogaster broomeanus]|nr:hypothetical protein BU15DRAFT_79711 [Melanogaster broomeanus]
MSAHGDLNKRSPGQAHRALAARFVPTYSYSGEVVDTTSPPTAASVANPVSASTTSPKTTNTPATPTTAATSAPTTNSTPTTPTTSPKDATSLTSSTTSSSTSSSSTPKASAASTPIPSPITTPNAGVPVTSVQIVTYASTATLSPSATPSSAPTSSANTIAIVGGVAGGVAALAVVGFLIMWCMRRQRNRDIDDFDPDAFKRQSAMLIDEPVQYNPRPPTMIERHNASPALAAQVGYGGQNFYGNYGGHDQPASYATGEIMQHTGSPPPQPYGQPPMGYSSYNDPQQLSRQPSNPAYINRQPSAAPSYGPPPVPVDPNYADLNRSSGTPFQAAQYADISRHLSAHDPKEQVAQPVGPLPNPFEGSSEGDTQTPAATSPEVHSEPTSGTAAPTSEAPAPEAPAQPRQNIIDPKQRPSSSYTVYDDGDAYGGI